MDKPSISVFYPMHNEEGNIRQAVHAALDVLPAVSKDYEIIIVDDGSSDDTGRIADELSHAGDKIRVVHHPVNLGYGGALKSGFRASRFELVFFTDGDNQFELGEIRELLKHIDRYDLVIGRRVGRKDPIHRRLNAWAWNILVRILFGLKVRDIDCAFKLIRKRVLDSVEFESNGAFISTELLVKVHEAGYTMLQVPVRHRPRTAGAQSGADLRVIARAFKDLFRMHSALRKKGMPSSGGHDSRKGRRE